MVVVYEGDQCVCYSSEIKQGTCFQSSRLQKGHAVFEKYIQKCKMYNFFLRKVCIILFEHLKRLH